MAEPQKIGNILADLLARRGFGRVQSTEAYEQAWRQAAGPLAGQYTRIGALRRGTLEVVVLNSTLVQELTYQKAALLKALNQLLPEQGIRDLRFRLGAIT
jgi:predicted nucleic acid-binding Zn ribbon protein